MKQKTNFFGFRVSSPGLFLPAKILEIFFHFFVVDESESVDCTSFSMELRNLGSQTSQPQFHASSLSQPGEKQNAKDRIFTFYVPSQAKSYNVHKRPEKDPILTIFGRYIILTLFSSVVHFFNSSPVCDVISAKLEPQHCSIVRRENRYGENEAWLSDNTFGRTDDGMYSLMNVWEFALMTYTQHVPLF